MKKLLTIMASLVIVLVGAVSLTACGKNNKAKWVESNLDEVIEFVTTADCTTIQKNYSSTAKNNITGQTVTEKYVDTTTGESETAKAEATFDITKESANHLFGISTTEEKVHVTAYADIQDGVFKIYAVYKDEKFKVDDQSNDIEASFSEASNILAMASVDGLEYLRDQHLTITKKQSGKTVQFRLALETIDPNASTDEIENCTEKISGVYTLTFTDGKLTQFDIKDVDAYYDAENQRIDNESRDMSYTIKAANNTITFPDGMSEWTVKQPV